MVKTESIGLLQKEIASTGAPFSVVFEITNQCNLRCVHCYQQTGDRELDLKQIKDVLDQLDKAGCLKLTLTGGEPTLRRDFADILAHCRSKGFAVTLFTNATRLSSAIKDALLQGPLLAVETSLYGASPETHDRITCVDGSFQKTLAGIHWLLANGFRVYVKSVMLSWNIQEMDALYELTTDLGVTFQPTYRIFPSLNPEKKPEQFRIGREALRALFKKRHRNPVEDLEDPDKDPDAFICNAGRSACAVNAEGKVYPCVALRWECGDLKEKGFLEVWHDSPVLETIRSYKDEDFAVCHECRWKTQCDFCPGMGYFEHGDVRLPSDELCRITRSLHGDEIKGRP